MNPEPERYWLLDYRIYDPSQDGKSKIDHAQDMVTNLVEHKRLEFRHIAFDTWYAAMDLLKRMEKYGKSITALSKVSARSVNKAALLQEGNLFIYVPMNSCSQVPKSSTANGFIFTSFPKDIR